MNPTTLFPSLWHRRAATVILIGSLVSIGLLSFIYYQEQPQVPLLITAALAGSAVAFFLALVAQFPVPDKFASWLAFSGFVVGVAALGASFMSYTSPDIYPNVHLVFVLSLSLFSLIAGIFGPVAWLFLIVCITPHFTTFFASGDNQSLSTTITFILSFALPLIASWFLWHGGTRRHMASQKHDNTYSTLAEQLNQVENESDIVISTIADGVIALDSKGIIQLINPAAQKTLGWSKRDSLSLDHHSVIKLQDKQGTAIPEELNPITIALHTNKPLERSDLVMETNTGKTFQARLSITPAGTTGDGVIVVFRDVTSEKAEEKEQAEFISTASHEMRTPVAAIEGYLGLALNPNTAAIDDKARLYLTKAHESAQHLGRLFQDLLDVTKADDGRLRNLPAVTDLVAFGADVVDGLTAKANEKGLTLNFAPLADASMTERKLTPVYYADVDNDHLREILNNLVDNAIKYTKAGTVTVNVSGNNENVEITIRDSGIGIPKEDIPHLFQKFYRVDNSDTREIGGTGLGLYLCRRLVELIGGKIWVESDYGHGSTFTVSLPRLDFDTAKARLQALNEQRQRQAANAAAKSTTTYVPPAASPAQAPTIQPAVARAPIVPAPPTPIPVTVAAPAPIVAPVAAPQPAPQTPSEYAMSPELQQQLTPESQPPRP